MISNGENWHYLAVKSLSRLLRGISSSHDGDYYCLNCFHSYRTENKLNVHKNVCENCNYCKIEMPSNDNNFIKYNQGEKSLKLPFVIYADLERILKKISTCYNNPDLSSTTKISQHVLSGYSIFTNCTFDKSHNKLSCYRGEDCMKRFCKDLKDHARRIIDFKKKMIIPLTKDEENSYYNEKVCHICLNDLDKDKVKDYCYFSGKYRGEAHNKCNLKHKIPKNIPIIFHNGSKYGYHFIIRELASEFEDNFECLGENTEKYVTFSVPIKKRIENKNMDVTYKIKFVDSFSFMATSLSKLVDNLTGAIHNDKCDNCEYNLRFVNATNETLTFECVDCKKEYKKEVNNKLKERFLNVYKFWDYDMNLSLLRKGVYPYEYMDDWDKFEEKELPAIESFHSDLTMEDISDMDLKHANNVFNKFNLNNLGDYHDLYVKSDTLLLAGIFENFRNACLDNYGLDPTHFVSLPGLAWQACLKKTNVKLELITDYDMFLIIEDEIRGGICHAIKRYAKANNYYMKDYNENEDSSCIQYLDINNLYGIAMCEKLPVKGFKWLEDISSINEEFVKNYDIKKNSKGYILKVDVDYHNELQDLHRDLPFLPERLVVNNTKKLICNLQNKKDYVVHINILKQALEHGLKLINVHKVIESDREEWLK